jgi:type IV pilus assembly protein PilW
MPQASHLGRARRRGFTLIELMIAVTVALFLLGGALTIVQSTRGTFGTQNLLAQLQDNERLTLTFMTEVIESAGYFPDPTNNTTTTALPVATNFVAGQAVFGNRVAGVPDDVTVRFAAAKGDANLFGCTGSTNTATAPSDTFTNKFYVKTVNGTPQLWCDFTSTAANVSAPLVNGVNNLVILYGIKRDATSPVSCTQTYLDASLMQTAGPNGNDWLHVCAVKVTVSFINPLNPAGTANSPNGPATFDISRVIAVMINAGVNP